MRYDIYDISERTIELLNNLIKDTDARIVISSAWRKKNHYT